jgi:hypothetical protein
MPTSIWVPIIAGRVHMTGVANRSTKVFHKFERNCVRGSEAGLEHRGNGDPYTLITLRYVGRMKRWAFVRPGERSWLSICSFGLSVDVPFSSSQCLEFSSAPRNTRSTPPNFQAQVAAFNCSPQRMQAVITLSHMSDT